MSSPFFPAICWHVDGASLAPRYLFDLPIFIPAFDYPITLEIICEPTRGFSLNNNPATRPSLFSHSFILHRQNRRENKKGFKKTPRGTMSQRQTNIPAPAFISGNAGSPQMSEQSELLQHCWDQWLH